MNELVVVQNGLDELVKLVGNGKSKNTKAAYGRAITDYAEWVRILSRGERLRKGTFTRYTILAYVDHLQNNESLSPATINQRLSALRSLAKELKYSGILDEDAARGIADIENLHDYGSHVGIWLSQEDARNLLDTPDQSTLKGKQERVMIALLMGAGLRRSEAATLQWEDIQEINGSWFITNIVGKHNRKRTIPLAPWAMQILLDWKDALKSVGYARTMFKAKGKILRAINRADNLTGCIRTRGGGKTDGGLSPQAIYKQVKILAEETGIPNLEPHSLRRTWAQTAYRQGCPLDQISLILGHQDLKTTEIYLGLKDLDMDEPFFIEY
jgi:site-specific recombinase XerD